MTEGRDRNPKKWRSGGSLALFDQRIAANSENERKGANHACAARNGDRYRWMQSLGKWAIRLPEGAREDFLKKRQAKLLKVYGAVGKEFESVPDALLGKPKNCRNIWN
jgi:hypothetical protein